MPFARCMLRGRVPRARDRGVSAIELAILAPAMLFMTILIIQWALWFQARGVALSAAQEGARVAREQLPGWQTQSRSVAESFYQRLGTRLLGNVPDVSLTQSGGQPPSQVYVTVTGQIPTLVPFIAPLQVAEKAGGPTECFRPAGSRGLAC